MDKACYKNSNIPFTTRIDDLLERMNLEEKIAQLSGIGPEQLLDQEGNLILSKAEELLKNGIGQITRIAGASGLKPEVAARAANQVQNYLLENTRLGVPALLHEECLSGLMAKGGTTYPQSIGMGATFEPDLMQAVTTEICKQIRAVGGHLALSPVLDVARDYRWGRVEETFGEDPYLVAAMAVAYVKGLQGNDLREGIIATLKHFLGHGFPEGGRNHAPVNVSERELREFALFPFEAAIREGKAGSVMNAYHSIDGQPCAGSAELLTDLLRGELGFDGIVVSDYYSIGMLHREHRIAKSLQMAGVIALEAGLDIELPETECYGERLVNAVTEGLISEATIDLSVRRHLKAKFEVGVFENPYVDLTKISEVFETKGQRKLAREAARKSMVLLKNEHNLLPLAKSGCSIAVIGPSADSTRNVLGDYAYSAHVNSPEDAVPVVSILEGIKGAVDQDVMIRHAFGCDIMTDNREGFAEAVKAAEKCDIAVVVVGGKSGLSGLVNADDGISEVDFSKQGLVTEPDGESHDRTSLSLTGVQEELVQAIVATKTPTIVILINGRPLAIEWIAENVPAIVEAWLPGSEAGTAVADVLFGDYNPGGRLPVSLPKNVGQLPIHYNRTHMSNNRKYVFNDNKPLYPFGYGLSYTTFAYDNLLVSPEKSTGGGEITIQFDVTNTGSVAGDEVVQLYISDLFASLTRPVKELKGFKRINLAPNETKQVIFQLAKDQLAFYDRKMNLIIEPGEFELLIGASSDDIRLRAGFEICGEVKVVPYSRTYFAKCTVLSKKEKEKTKC